MAPETTSPLSPEHATRLTEFARACQAAARAAALYPGSHPAIGATLARIVSVTSGPFLPSAMRLAVLPDALTIDGRLPARADAAIAELAALLHQHLIIELTVHSGGDADAWRRFLALLGRSPEAIRAEGGIARVWAAMAGRHVEVREIDYDAMRSERAYHGSSPTDRILAVLKQNDGRLFDPHLVRRFVQLVGIYTAGNLVRLDTDEIAVVLKVNALDPHRPQVRVLLAQDGSRLESSYDCSLWGSDHDPAGPPGSPSSIVAPLDPDDYGIDPLLLI